jgi:hypothetical protein
MEVQILSHAPAFCSIDFKIWGREAVYLTALIRQSSHVRIVPPEQLRRLAKGLPSVEEDSASLNLVVAASFAGVR